MGRPLHVPLSLWHCDIGMQVVHSGLVARVENGRAAGVLFPGMGGSGKSTSSLTCLEAGLSYLGDDYIGLSEDGAGGFIGHSVYNSSHLEPHHLKRFTRLAPHAIPAKLEMEDKWLILLAEVFPGQFMTQCPIRAIALPRVVDTEVTRFRKATRVEAMLALAPSSLVMIPGRGAAGMQKLGALVESVACYWLELGRQLPSVPVAVDALLSDALKETRP
jgi:serine kinase of HPr protein (carbohydrate metabolism regulator)